MAKAIKIAISVYIIRMVTITILVLMATMVTIAMNIRFNGKSGHASHDDFHS